jgi:hypothetical protein
MTITLNHTVLAAADNERAARRFAATMGLEFDGFAGVDGKFAAVRVNDQLRLFFVAVDPVVPQHLAFDVDPDGHLFEVMTDVP